MSEPDGRHPVFLAQFEHDGRVFPFGVAADAFPADRPARLEVHTGVAQGESKRVPAAAGFSLIEILVVITIIGLLMGFAALTLGRYRETGRITDCQARIEAVSLQVESYADRTGAYPPGTLGPLGVKDANDVNQGIEALVAALRSRDYAGKRPDERWLGNVDDDHPHS